MRIFDILAEYFPDVTLGVQEHILWTYTGYPAFWRIPEDGATPEECLRKQLSEVRDYMAANSGKLPPEEN